MIKQLVVVLVLSACAMAQAGGQVSGAMSLIAPLPPQIMLPTTFNATNFPTLSPTPARTATVCASGCTYTTLTAALAGASCDEIISVAPERLGFQVSIAGGVTNLITSHCAVGHWLKITTQDEALLPQQGSSGDTCTNIGLRTINVPCTINHNTDGPHMWKLVKTGNGVTTFDTAVYFCGNSNTEGCPATSGTVASGVIITGMDYQATGTGVYAGFGIGSYVDTITPSRIIFDRCTFDTTTGTFSTQQTAMIAIYGTYVAVVDSTENDQWMSNQNYANLGGTQSQFITSHTGGQVVKIVHNYICGALTENVLIGGSDVNHLGQPTDWEVRTNTLCKDVGVPGLIGNPNSSGAGNAIVANDFEAKTAIARLLFRGNTMLWTYNDAPYYLGGGTLFSLKVDQNCFGTCNLAEQAQNTVSDIIVEGNYGMGFATPFGVFGHNTNGTVITYAPNQRVRFQHNLFTNENFSLFSNYGSTRGILVTSGGATGVGDLGTEGPFNFVIDSIDVLAASSGSNGNYMMYVENPPPAACANGWPTIVPGLQITNSIFESEATQLVGDCYATTAAIIGAGVFPYADFAGNVFGNFAASSGTTCSGWTPYNPGKCYPSTPPNNPTLVNSKLGFSSYGPCGAGTDYPSGWTTDCAIVVNNIGTGPNITLMQLMMSEGNDAIEYGIPRNPF